MASRSVSQSSFWGGTWGEALADGIGTFILIIFGDGCVATFKLFGAENGSFAHTWPVITLGWGLAVMLGVYVAGAISGAHLNPAVTLGLAATGRFPWSKVGPYILAQVLGAFVAAGILWFIYAGPMGAAVNHAAVTDANVGAVNIFYTANNPNVGYFGAFCTEFLGTAVLVGLILAITDGRNQPVQANLNPLIIGFLIVAIGTSLGLNSGYAINPARDFGPRLWATFFWGGVAFNSYTWIPIVAPIVGGVAGAFIYDFTIGKVLAAKMLMKSGDSETKGTSVREPAVD